MASRRNRRGYGMQECSAPGCKTKVMIFRAKRLRVTSADGAWIYWVCDSCFATLPNGSTVTPAK